MNSYRIFSKENILDFCYLDNTLLADYNHFTVIPPQQIKHHFEEVYHDIQDKGLFREINFEVEDNSKECAVRRLLGNTGRCLIDGMDIDEQSPIEGIN